MKFSFNGKEYDASAMPDKVQYMIKQVKHLNQDISDLSFEIDQKKAAVSFFEGKISSYLEALEGISEDGDTNEPNGT